MKPVPCHHLWQHRSQPGWLSNHLESQLYLYLRSPGVHESGKRNWYQMLRSTLHPLPEQTNKEIATMLQKLQDVISQILGVECMPVTKDLLDYYPEEA